MPSSLILSHSLFWQVLPGFIKTVDFPWVCIYACTYAIEIAVSSWMFQEISELCRVKVPLILHVCVRQCVPAEGMIWVPTRNNVQEVY